MAKELAWPRWYSGTVFSIIPVNGGRTKPPKNSMNQTMTLNGIRSSKNGAGRLERQAKRDTNTCSF